MAVMIGIAPGAGPAASDGGPPTARPAAEVARPWPDRVWAVENANGLGRLLSRRRRRDPEQFRVSISGQPRDIGLVEPSRGDAEPAFHITGRAFGDRFGVQQPRT